MKKLLMVAALAIAPAALAEPTYSFVSFAYQMDGEISTAGGSIDTDAYNFKGSFAVSDGMFVEFVYNSIGTDPSALDITDYALAFGFNGEMGYAKFGYESAEFDFCAIFGAPPCTLDDSGFTADFGLRSQVSDQVELNAHVGYSDLGDLETYTNVGFGVAVNVSESADLTFNFDKRLGDSFDIQTITIGVRFNFE